MSYGGTDSSNGTYGPVGASTGSEPQPSSGGTVGPAGPAGPPGPNIDRYAATRIVSLDPDQGTDTTIQAAIDNLPAEGGTIFVREGTYVISAPIVLPNKPIQIIGAGWGTILSMPSFAGDLFEVADGLTEVRQYVIRDFQAIGSGDLGQTFWCFDDTNGLADCLAINLKVSGFETFVDWMKYNLNYDRQSNVWVYDSSLEPIEGGSVLAKTPNAAGSFFAPVALRIYETTIGSIDVSGTTYVWSADADADLWLENCQALQVAAGSKFNGLMTSGTPVTICGAGDVTFFGAAWGAWDYASLGTTFGSFHPVTHLQCDSRLILTSGNGTWDIAYCDSVSLKFVGPNKVRISEMSDAVGLSNPGVELTSNNSIVSDSHFRSFPGAVTVFPQGCVKLTSVFFCKVHDCDFATTVTGKTVLETGTSDKNCIHDNTGFASGTGNTVNINGNDQVHNNIN